MHKKQIFYSALIILISAIIWFLSSNNKSTIAIDNNFAVTDTSSISKIFIADRSGTTITLKRENNNWIVNDRYIVRKDAINTLLTTIKEITIQRPVPKNSFENVVKNLATTGVKIEIYGKENQMLKNYTIGSSTSNHLGTYMLLNNAKNPFVLHIPFLNGFLSPRYGIQGNKLNLNNWRSTSIFKLLPEEIKNVEVKHLLSPEESFSFKANPNIIQNFKGEDVSFNNTKLLQFINSFKSLNCESFKGGKELIEFSRALHELKVNDDILRTYEVGSPTKKTKENNFNVKRMYATLNNGEVMLIQDYVFNKVLINISQLQ